MKPFTHCPTDDDILHRMKESLDNAAIREAVSADFTKTFEQIWMEKEQAEELTDGIFRILKTEETREGFEVRKHGLLTRAQISWKPFLVAMSESMQGRAEKILGQILPHISENLGPILDFGAGDGQVSELVRKATKRHVDGFDVSPFTHQSVSEPVLGYDGTRIPRGNDAYDDAIATNVLHHEANNQKCIDELTRLTRERLTIIETVPTGETAEAIEEDRWRTFMNDVMWNSILKKPKTGIPIPGSYETPERWIERFEATRKWSCWFSEDLGIDQKTIQDTHHLLVFDRK